MKHRDLPTCEGLIIRKRREPYPMLRSFLLLKAIVASGAALMSATCPAENLPQGVNFLKDFTSHTPVIEELNFTFRRYQSDGSFVDSRYDCRWQPNAFAVTIATKSDPFRPTEFSETNVFAKHGETYWNYHGIHSILQSWENRNKPEETNNQVFLANIGNLVPVREVLSWGIPHTEIGTLKWQGNEFSSTNAIVGTEVYGSVFANSFQDVSKISLSINAFLRNPPATFRWQIGFDYWRENPHSGEFPKDIYVDLLRGEGDIFRMYDYRDIRIKTNSQPAMVQYFEPDYVLNNTGMVRYFAVLSNKVLQVTESNGRKYTSSVADDPAFARIASQKVWVRIYLIAAALLALGPIIFLTVAARKKSKTKTT